MRDPFKIDGLTAISFSGGRTSAYMLWRVLQANGEKLPEGVEVCFANTGKEREETLEFVRNIEQHWGVPIRWLEFRPKAKKDVVGEALWNLALAGAGLGDVATPLDVQFETVNFETASRNGEPFEALIKQRNFLPNPMARFCTVELKIKTQHAYLRSIGWTEWQEMVGIRADEPRRVAKIRGGETDGPERLIPLADDGVTKNEVSAFWKSRPFDLGLPLANGVTIGGNCDLCFLKGASTILSSIKAEPSRAIWWAAQEGSISNAKVKAGGTFRSDRPTYQQMHDYALRQGDMFDASADESIECFCGD